MQIQGRAVALLTFMYFTLAGCHELGHIDGLGDYGRLKPVAFSLRAGPVWIF